MHFTYRALCFEHRIVPVSYFMDEMQWCEVNDMIENIKYVDRTERELGRYSIYANVLSNGGKIKIEDIMKLPWDDEGKNVGTPVNEEEAMRLKARAAQLAHAIENMKFSKIDNASLLKNTTD